MRNSASFCFSAPRPIHPAHRPVGHAADADLVPIGGETLHHDRAAVAHIGDRHDLIF